MDKNLVIQTAFLGDALLSIPLLRRLKSNYPKHKLEFLCKNGVGDLFLKLKLVDTVYEVNKKLTYDWDRINNTLLSSHYDLVLAPHESLRTAFLVKNIQARKKIGFYKWWNFLFFDVRIPRPKHLPDALRQLSLLSEQDKTIFENLKSYKTGFSDWASMTVDFKPDPQFKDYQDAVLIAPGSVWETKRWTIEGFSELAQILSQKNKIVFIGSQEERQLCQTISDTIPGSHNLAGQTTLWELLNVVKMGKLLICNDSGAMHIGSVVGIPTVAIFGPTVQSQGYIPWQKNAVVIEKDLFCRPCGKHGHTRCPLGTHDCMKQISAGLVLDKIRNLTNRSFASAQDDGRRIYLPLNVL